MNKARMIGIGIVSIVVITLIVAVVYVGPIEISKPQEKEKNPYEGWNTSGPFNINKFEYELGTNIFISVDGLKRTDVGSMSFILPSGNTTYISIPFDGSVKTAFNQYFKPGISKARHICSVDDLVGQWTIKFQGTDYKPIKFTILNKTLVGEESYFERVC
ncbi:MAG TPA: hypothetical protein VFM64_04965 [Candidatus Nitrosotenuis sp.]|nr:hypothetical protein [Candidatus Nitrosotenuis sp.]